MLDMGRRGDAGIPGGALLLAGAVLLVVLISVLLQPPRAADSTDFDRMISWGRVLLFTLGALAFVVGLATVDYRPRRRESGPLVETRPPRLVERPYTVVTLGRGIVDPRAITDAPTAAAALRVLRRWRMAYPDEHIVIFAPDGTPAAYSLRPSARPIVLGRVLSTAQRR
jgi:hypothetical protein